MTAPAIPIVVDGKQYTVRLPEPDEIGAPVYRIVDSEGLGVFTQWQQRSNAELIETYRAQQAAIGHLIDLICASTDVVASGPVVYWITYTDPDGNPRARHFSELTERDQFTATWAASLTSYQVGDTSEQLGSADE